MKYVVAAAALIALAGPTAARSDQFPGPTYRAITVQGNILAGSATIAGATTLTGGGRLSGTFAGPTILTGVTPTLTPYTVATLPSVTTANAGEMVFAKDCPNGAETSGSGCPYYVNSNGQWVALPSPPSASIIIGGQQVRLGGLTSNQGNGRLIQLATGSYVVGHALAYDNNGNAIDSGVVPGGGTGGGGTVASAPQNSIPFYTNVGTNSVIGGLAITNNAVLATNGSGVPSEVTVLPTGLTIPGAIISSPTLTGSVVIPAATYTGKQTYTASTTAAASMNIPAGVAPTSPLNGDLWATTGGLLYRANGATQGPLIATVTGSSPIVISGSGTASLTATCPTCATTQSGGPLSGTAPISVVGNSVSLGGTPQYVGYVVPSNAVVANDTIPIFDKWIWAGTGTINSVTYHTGGTGTPSFQIGLQINGANVTGCTGITVNSATDLTTTCTGANTIANNQVLNLVISSVSGAPSAALVSLNVTKPAL